MSNLNKCTLLIDGNWLLMSRFSMIKENFLSSNSENELESAKENLKDFLARSIVLQINKFWDIIDNIILVTDGGSWRNHVPKPSFFKEEYKGNREKDEEIEWSYVYEALGEIRENLSNVGITACKYSGVEGDDWIWYWSTYLNKNGVNCIIWSTDCDLKQLINNNDNGIWTVWYNDKSGLVLPESLNNETSNDIDFFMNYNYVSPLLENLKKQSKKGFNYINPEDIIIEKVICGDKGDNIKPILVSNSGSKNYRITPLMFSKIREKLEINNLNEFISRKSEIIKYIIDNKGTRFKNNTNTQEELEELFDYNLKLVWLNEKQFPCDLFNEINKTEYKIGGIDFIKNNFKVITNTQESIPEDIIFEDNDFFNNELPY